MNEQTKQILLNDSLRWAVFAQCEAKNGGKWEQFGQLLAVFVYPQEAEDFINNCLPAERRDLFKVIDLQA